jgi:hypothetical protein
MAADTFVKEQLYVSVVAQIIPHMIKMGDSIPVAVDMSHDIAMHAIRNYDKAFPDGKKPPKDNA